MKGLSGPRFGEPIPGAVYRPRPSAYAVVLDEAGRVALVEEDGEWLLPGGGIEGTESPEQAVVREVREECGCGARVLALLGEAFEFVETRAGEHYDVHGTYFRAEFVGRSLASWHSPAAAEELVQREGHAWILRSLQGGR
jgi:8-oxo-dGTP diphosphatase